MSISLEPGNSCPSGFNHIGSWQACRAALSIYSALNPSNSIDGMKYRGVEPGGPSEEWPKGCYYCKNVPDCTNGVWFNGASIGSEVTNGKVFCGDDHYESMIDSDQYTRLFVGDSDIDFWGQLENTFGSEFPNTSNNINGIAAYNVGVGGYTCPEVFDETSSFIDVFNPDQVVLVCGENDLYDYTVQQTFQNYKRVVLAFTDSGAKVFSFSTKPEPSTSGIHSKYRQLDNMIKDWALSDMSPSDFVFIDSYNGFNDIGNGNNLYDDDRLHLSSLGYSYWEDWLDVAFADTSNSCQIWRSGECDSQSTPSPTPSSSCLDGSLKFKVRKNDGRKITRDCPWVAVKAENRCSFDGVSSTCPGTCGTCDICEDSTLRFKIVKGDGKKIMRDCAWVAVKPGNRCSFDGVSGMCRETCGIC